MNTLTRRISKLELILNYQEPARIYDYRDQTDEAWLKFCDEMYKGFGTIEQFIYEKGELRDTELDRRIREAIGEMKKTPKEKRFA